MRNTLFNAKHSSKKCAICLNIWAGSFTLNIAAKSSCAGGHLLPIRAQCRGKNKFESTNLRSNLQRTLWYKGQSKHTWYSSSIKRPFAECRQYEKSLSYTGASNQKFLFTGASRSRNSACASDREQQSLRQTFLNAATDESECSCNEWGVDVGEPSLTRSLRKRKFNMMCIWPYVLHVNLKAVDTCKEPQLVAGSETPLSLQNSRHAPLNWYSASACLFCWASSLR